MTAATDGTAALTAAIQAVELARRAGAGDAEAGLRAARSSSVRVRDGQVDERVDTETGILTLRVFVGSRTAAATTSDIAPDALARLAADAVALARLTAPDPDAGLPDGPFPAANGDDTTLDLVDPALLDPAPDLLLALARQADAAARGLDRRVRSGEGATAARQAGMMALANSRGFAASYPATACYLVVSAAADDAEGKKREGWWYAADRRLAGMEDAETVGRTAAERARRQLGARPVPTREAPVVWAPEAAREFLGILAQAAAGDFRYRGASFLIDREGEQLASPLVTITDDATLPGRGGSRPFDVEGVASRRTSLFEAGTFVSFLYDAYSGRKAGRPSTANAGRSSIPGVGSRIGVAPSNLVMAPGVSSPEAIIAGVEDGLYLTDMLGSGENLATGDFSRGAAGLWIEHGELAYPVGEINISGRLQEMLLNIDAVGNDARFVDTASAPTFRIARMMVSGR
ncbi:MAG: TldD/PmbA family protein [Chloroflexia bacterium]|nr:TldD/PmbA family protein [Chloroflexia bacterium]